MSNYRITKTKSVHETTTHHISRQLKYVQSFVDGKEVSRSLRYRGKKFRSKDDSWWPYVVADRSILKNHHPFCLEGNEYDEFFSLEVPPVEELDVSQVVLVSTYSHSLAELDGTPIPFPITGDYIGASLHNGAYHLKPLREHLLNHPHVLSCSEIEPIPYYNRDVQHDEFLEVKVLPTVELLTECWATKRASATDFVFGSTWDEDGPDFLDIKQFLKKRVDECSFD